MTHDDLVRLRVWFAQLAVDAHVMCDCGERVPLYPVVLYEEGEAGPTFALVGDHAGSTYEETLGHFSPKPWAELHPAARDSMMNTFAKRQRRIEHPRAAP